MEMGEDRPMTKPEIEMLHRAAQARYEAIKVREDFDVLHDAMGAVACGQWRDPAGFRAFAEQALAAVASSREHSDGGA